MRFIIVATSFSPQNRIGAIRTTKLAKYLAKAGHNVNVITPLLDESEEIDASLNINNIELISIFRIPYGKIYTKTLGKLRSRFLSDKRGSHYTSNPDSKGTISSIKGSAIRAVRFIYLWLEERSWLKQVSIHLSQDDNLKKSDVIISSSPKPVVHKIAQNIKALNEHSLWIADFRDPMFYEMQSALIRYINKKAQDRIVKRCDYVTIVSNDSREKFLCEGIDNTKVHWIPNGYDPDDLSFVSSVLRAKDSQYSSKVFTIGYAGSLIGGKRDLSIIFKALKALIDEGLISMSKVQFIYAGSEGSRIVSIANRYALKDRVVDKGMVKREEALSFLKSSDCTVVCTHNSKRDKGILTGKLYEAFMIGNPVIAIVNGDLPGSELGKMVRNMNAGIVFEEANAVTDYIRLKEFLLKSYVEKEETGNVEKTIDEEIKQGYTYERITANFLRLIVEE